MRQVYLLLVLMSLRSAIAADSYVRVPVEVIPPQEIRAISLRAGEDTRSFEVRDGVLLVSADFPMPWTVALTRFEPAVYTRADRERGALLRLAELGTVSVRLRGTAQKSEAVTACVLRAEESAPLEVSLVADDSGVFRTRLRSGVYAAAFLGSGRATRIRSGIVIRPGQVTDLGELPFEPGGAVTLRVVDDKSRRPVAGASVTWSPPAALNADVARRLFSKIWSATTDRAGRVTFRTIGPPPLPARWSVRAEGYAPTVTAQALVSGTSPVVLADTMLRAESVLIVETQLPQPDRDFREASVMLSEPEDEISPRYELVARQPLREEQNQFRVANTGRMRLTIESKQGRKLYYKDISVEPGENRVVLTPIPTKVMGRVTRAEKTLEGVFVIAADRHDARVILAQTRTDSSGEYALSTYQVGRVFLYTNGPRENGVMAGSEDRDLSLGDKPEVRVDFELPTAGVSILVVDAQTGAPLRARAQGVLRSGNTGRGAFIETDEDGRGRIIGAPVGKATVFIRAEGYRGREITLDVDVDTPEVKIELTRGGSISGRVIDGSGTPIAGARVFGAYPSAMDMQGRFEETTDAAGRFRFQDSPEPGTPFYVFAKGTALSVAFLREGIENVVRVSPPNAGAVTIVSNHALPKTLNLFLPVLREGTVIPYGALAELALLNGMTPFQLLSTGRDGTLVLPEFLAPGNYTLCIVRSKDRRQELERVSELKVPAPAGAVIIMQ